jgi:hypothetical protein
MEMKKIGLLFLICLMSLTIQAQVEHFKFMGIPIDGKISVFEKQLKKKGFASDVRFKMLPKEYFSTTRIYKGSFANEDDVSLVVNFDKNTKIVYSVNVIIECYSQNNMIKKYDEYESMYREKYTDSMFKDLQTERKTGISIGVPYMDQELCGFIFLAKDVEPGTEKCSVTIEYIDRYNFENKSSNSLNDL